MEWTEVFAGLFSFAQQIYILVSAPLRDHMPANATIYAGMAFAYFLVFPLTLRFFAAATPEGVAMMTDIAHYLDFVTVLFFAFEIPVAVVLLVWIDVEYLKKSRPYVIIRCFVICMLLTPPEIFSQTLLAVPMWLLFEVGVLCSILIRRRLTVFEPR